MGGRKGRWPKVGDHPALPACPTHSENRGSPPNATKGAVSLRDRGMWRGPESKSYSKKLSCIAAHLMRRPSTPCTLDGHAFVQVK